MADVRALLKAKNKERQQEIQHPLASYNASGQLRCSLCGTLIKFSSAWKAHLESKVHKTNESKEAERLRKGKRKADISTGLDEMVLDDASKKRKVDTPPAEAKPTPDGFPSDFFSNPNRTLPQPNSDDEEEDDDNPGQAKPPPTSVATATIDDEWEAFEKAVRAPIKPKTNIEDIFNKATVFAEPELVDVVADGFPSSVLEGDAPNASANPSTGGRVPGQPEQAEEKQEETEHEKRRRKEQEDKELIMDRLLDEERAQEDADERVRTLRARVEALKLQRQARKTKKAET